MAPLTEGERSQALTSTYGRGDHRWLRIASAARQPQAQRLVDTQGRTQRAQAVNTLQQLCGTPLACAAEARQALVTFAQGLQATFLPTGTVYAQPRSRKRGRPGRDAPPDQGVSQSAGAWASAMTARPALIDQHRGFLLATNALDEAQLPPHAVLARDKGQVDAERGFRFLQAPQFFASSLYLKKPERLMALLMVMTVCFLVYAALEYRIRHILKTHHATFPDQTGKRVQHPTARWVFHYFVGIHLRRVSGQWPLVLNLTEEQSNLLKLLGKPSMQLYGVQYS